jgi:hypothetical protein
MPAAIKFALASLAVSILSVATLALVLGGVGPCATTPQAIAVLLTLAGLASCVSTLLIYLPLHAHRKHQATRLNSTLSLSK